MIPLPDIWRRRETAAGLRHLWGIVISARGQEVPARSHYSLSAARRAIVRRRHTRLGFGRTLERVGQLIPPDRLMIVLLKRELHDLGAALHASGVRPVIQPSWRGSAAEVFLAALRVTRDDPHATIALLPSEDLAEHADIVMRYIGRAARAVDLRPDLAVVIGAPGSRGTGGAAWIEPGGPVERLEGFGIRTVARFVPHATAAESAALFDAGAVTATRVLVAKAPTLLALGRARLPDVLETLEPLEDAASNLERELLCDAVYECMPLADLVSALPPRGDGFAVLPIPDVIELDRPARLLLAS